MLGALRDARVLVTGSAGLVGHAVARRLEAAGASVLGVDRAPGADASLDLVHDPWPEGHFDAIVHSAAQLPMRFDGPEADEATTANVAMDARALDLASALGAHLVYFSTASVYGDTVGMIDEDTPPSPQLGYARAKLATEEAITTRGVAATVFRLVAPYGPRQTRMTVLLRFIDAALRGAPLRYYGTGSRTQDFLHVDDVADAVALALARRGTIEMFVLASGVATSMRALAELVVRALSSASPVEEAGVPDPEESRLVTYQVDRMRERLAFVPSRALADGIVECAAAREAQRVGEP
jgi:nucleoside-diphosphate-sugar epimerase